MAEELRSSQRKLLRTVAGCLAAVFILPVFLGFALADATWISPPQVRSIAYTLFGVRLIASAVLVAEVVWLWRRRRPSRELKNRVVIATVLAGPVGLAYSVFALTARRASQAASPPP